MSTAQEQIKAQIAKAAREVEAAQEMDIETSSVDEMLSFDEVDDFYESPEELEVDDKTTSRQLASRVLEEPESEAGTFANVRTLVLGLIVCIIAAIACQYLALQRTQTRAEQMALTTQMIVSAERVSHEVSSALVNRDPRSFSRLRSISERFDGSIKQLTESGSGIPGASQPVWFFDALDSAGVKWNATRAGVIAIVGGKGVLTPTWHELTKVGEHTNALIASTSALRNNLLANPASLKLIHLGGQQQILAERVARNLTRFASSSSTGHQALKDIRASSRQFEGVYLDLRRESPVSAQRELDAVETAWRRLRDSVGIISNNAETYINVGHAGKVVEEGSFQLVNALESLMSRLQTDNRFGWLKWIPWVMALASIAFLVLIARRLIQDTSDRLVISQQRNEETQESILRLLDGLDNLADGDLTTQAEVGDRMTGAIAGAVNYAIREMRTMVRGIRDAAQQVSTETSRSHERAEQLATVSQQQAGQITEASAKVSSMATGMRVMANKATESVAVADGSREVAKRGADAVRSTIDGLNAIRERTQQTSKRIKRLGESSQQISEIVAIIEDIADKTNMLSMNASIQAETAGEFGREFAAVADEVQALAERSSQATAQIGGLVTAIQNDTNDAVASMEFAIYEVVEGTQVADQAGNALNEIERESEQLAQLIERIAQASEKHADSATGVSDDMQGIRSATQNATESVRETAKSVGRLAELATELQSSVKGFRLPD